MLYEQIRRSILNLDVAHRFFFFDYIDGSDDRRKQHDRLPSHHEAKKVRHNRRAPAPPSKFGPMVSVFTLAGLSLLPRFLFFILKRHEI